MRVALVRRSECVPYSLGSSPTLPIQSDTRRAYWRVVMLFWGPRRPANKNSPGFLLVVLRNSSTAWRVCSVNSNRTGRPVFFWRTVARSAVYPPAATSSTLIATTSQPRSLLSIARLNIARSRTRPSIWSFVRIDQTCLGRSGGFAPVSLPLFQGVRVGLFNRQASLSDMVVLLGY